MGGGGGVGGKRSPKKDFPALRASFWSKDKGGGSRSAPLDLPCTDIDGMITEFARLKGTHLALCL